MGVVQRLGCRLQGLGFRIYVRLRVGSLGLWVGVFSACGSLEDLEDPWESCRGIVEVPTSKSIGAVLKHPQDPKPGEPKPLKEVSGCRV